MKSSYIWITTQFEGFHKYPLAPDNVSFLRNEHRHIFKIKVWISIKHDDREIEFFQFKRFIDSLIVKSHLNNNSCEMISNFLYNNIILRYPNRQINIEVSEDGENGSYIEY